MLTDNVTLSGKTILVTGAAGFIGANLCKRLLSDYADCKVVGNLAAQAGVRCSITNPVVR